MSCFDGANMSVSSSPYINALTINVATATTPSHSDHYCNYYYDVCNCSMSQSVLIPDIFPNLRYLLKLNLIISASFQVGNSDLVGFFIYRNTKQLLKMTTDVKQLPGVDKVMWSEEVYSINVDKSKNVKEGNTNLFFE
jgi:hypothetical protein